MLFAAASTGLILVLFLTGLFVVFTPLPLSLTILRKGPWAGLLATAAVFGVLIALYRLPGDPVSFLPMMVFHPSLSLKGVMGLSVVYLLYYVGLGWLMAFASRWTGRWSSLEPAVAGMTIVGLAVPALVLAAFTFFAKVDLSSGIVHGLESLFQRMIDIQQSSGLAEEDVAFLRASAPAVIAKFLQVLPSLWIDLTLAILGLNILFLRRWVRETKLFPRWPDFGLWRLDENLIWAPIAAGAVYFLNVYVMNTPSVDIAALNVLIVLAAVYFFQGLAVASFFFRVRLSPWMRLAGYLLFFIFFQVGVVVVMGVGVADFWFDFRKLKKLA